MEYNGIKFEAIIATPGCGKSYLADNYPDLFADMDEIRLKCKYEVPNDITREELEKTKGNRDFKKRKYSKENLFKEYDKCLDKGMILLAAPHPESFEYFEKKNIKFCFIYPDKNARQALTARFKKRNNSNIFIKENDDLFDEFYMSNRKDTKAVIHYEFNKNEYLSDILKKFNLNF